MNKIRILQLDDAETWDALVDQLPHKDVVHYSRFSRVYEEYGDGRAECFVFEGPTGTVVYPYIRRPMMRLPFGARFSNYEDVVTPYCYGGFVHSASASNAAELLKGFRRAFEDYARRSGIVSEFIRFHPALQNQRHCEGLFDTLFMHRQNVVVDLRQEEQVLFNQCRPTLRNLIRRARRSGLVVEQIDASAYVDLFADMYRETMRRHHQTGYLGFSPKLFHALVRNLPEELKAVAVRLEGRVVAIALFLCFGDLLDYFLAASDTEFLRMSPNHLMLHEVSVWAHRQELKYLHLGGGRDSLMFFKRGFSPLSWPFFIAQKIHNAAVYEQLREARVHHVEVPFGDPNFFPAYSSGLE